LKRIKKLLRKLKNNAGSSIIMVIVSIAFIGIVVGALLSAAVQSYRLKLVDMNSKENFYYVEQALNEIYTGVGSQTVEDLKNAYVYTVENMVQYDLGKGRYVTKTPEQTQKMFTDEFYRRLSKNDFFKDNNVDALATKLRSYITNDSVKLDDSRMVVEVIKDGGDDVGKVIRNVTLTRTAEYNRSSENGMYTQTITTDIVIGKPDFAVQFDAVNDQDPNIFKYALVADMGICVDQKTTPLTIAGNVYAASDYYNKSYNENTWNSDAETKKFTGTTTYEIENEDGTKTNLTDLYVPDSITSLSASGEKTTPTYTYWDDPENVQSDPTKQPLTKNYYDGENIKSKYSGFYVDGSQVSIMADTIVIPGTMAVMNKGSLSVYGKNGTKTSESEVWTDDVVLDGLSTVNTVTNETTGVKTKKYKGSSAIFKANMYVKDDTELNAAGSTFQLTGSYYGYGDSTEKDTRKFTPVVNAENFQVAVTNADGTSTTENRGHYNSSAIIVNGEQSTLNFAQAKNIFLAGRTYIELSKDVNTVAGKTTETAKDKDGKETTVEVDTVTDVYTYHPVDYNAEMPASLRTDDNKTTTIRDYKMGESISVKSNQQAYIPITSKGVPTLAKNTAGESLGYYVAELPPALKGSTLFERYFPEAVFDGKVPCVLQEVSGKKYYYYDFSTAYYSTLSYWRAHNLAGNISDLDYDNWIKTYPSPQYYAAGFIHDYSAELEMHRKYVAATDKKGLTDSVIAEYLVDIGDYEDFDAGDIVLPDTVLNPNVSIYSSGAITTKSGTQFSIVRSDNMTALQKLLTSENMSSLPEGVEWNKDDNVDGSEKVYTDVYQLSNDMELEYEYMKWNLGHYSATGDALQDSNNNIEKQYIKDLISSKDFGDSYLTPINKFTDVSLIDSSVTVSPNISGSDVSTSSNVVLDLASKYSVWISDKNVTVKARKEDKGKVRGIVITKGNVYFDDSADNGVTDFEGAIIAGGKVYINGKVSAITSSPEICRAILRECLLNYTKLHLKDSDPALDKQDPAYAYNLLLSLFRGYSVSGDNNNAGSTEDDTVKSIDSIDYTDVVSFTNWMKNVE
jgi:hypothetical protein